EHERNLAQPRHQGDVLLVVDLEFLLVDDGREHIGAGIADLQRVAVGPRTRHFLDRKDAEGAGLIFDHHRLAENRPHMLADDAHDDIGGAARPKWHDDLDRLRGIFVLRGNLAAAEGKEKYQQNAQALHVIVRFRRCFHDLRSEALRSLPRLPTVIRASTFMRRRFALAPTSRYSANSILTSATVFRHAASSLSSHDCASCNDAFGLTLTSCFLNASCSCGASAASTIALKRAARTSFGVLAGASMLCQCKVPTPG